MNDARTLSEDYAGFFAYRAAELYGAIKPIPAVRDANTLIAERATGLRKLIYRDAHFPAIAEFLAERKISALSLLAETTHCSVFEIPGRDQVLRIGPQGNRQAQRGLIMDRNRAWCPLVLQPVVQEAVILPYDRKYAPLRLTMEILPRIEFLPNGKPEGFKEFINRHVLTGTPYAVHHNKDLAVLPDGTPVFGDPDSLTFRDYDHARRHSRDQYRPEWRQQIMEVIAENCARARLTDKMSWVAQAADGTLITHQEKLYGSPAAPLTVRRFHARSALAAA